MSLALDRDARRDRQPGLNPDRGNGAPNLDRDRLGGAGLELAHARRNQERDGGLLGTLTNRQQQNLGGLFQDLNERFNRDREAAVRTCPPNNPQEVRDNNGIPVNERGQPLERQDYINWRQNWLEARNREPNVMASGIVLNEGDPRDNNFGYHVRGYEWRPINQAERNAIDRHLPTYEARMRAELDRRFPGPGGAPGWMTARDGSIHRINYRLQQHGRLIVPVATSTTPLSTEQVQAISRPIVNDLNTRLDAEARNASPDQPITFRFTSNPGNLYNLGLDYTGRQWQEQQRGEPNPAQPGRAEPRQREEPNPAQPERAEPRQREEPSLAEPEQQQEQQPERAEPRQQPSQQPEPGRLTASDLRRFVGSTSRPPQNAPGSAPEGQSFSMPGPDALTQPSPEEGPAADNGPASLLGPAGLQPSGPELSTPEPDTDTQTDLRRATQADQSIGSDTELQLQTARDHRLATEVPVVRELLELRPPVEVGAATGPQVDIESWQTAMGDEQLIDGLAQVTPEVLETWEQALSEEGRLLTARYHELPADSEAAQATYAELVNVERYRRAAQAGRHQGDTEELAAELEQDPSPAQQAAYQAAVDREIAVLTTSQRDFYYNAPINRQESDYYRDRLNELRAA